MPLQRWEYLKVTYTGTEALNMLGDKGWELIQIDDSYYYFKRPIEDETSLKETRGILPGQWGLNTNNENSTK